jgi:hypothetical protein
MVMLHVPVTGTGMEHIVYGVKREVAKKTFIPF